MGRHGDSAVLPSHSCHLHRVTHPITPTRVTSWVSPHVSPPSRVTPIVSHPPSSCHPTWVTPSVSPPRVSPPHQCHPHCVTSPSSPHTSPHQCHPCHPHPSPSIVSHPPHPYHLHGVTPTSVTAHSCHPCHVTHPPYHLIAAATSSVAPLSPLPPSQVVAPPVPPHYLPTPHWWMTPFINPQAGAGAPTRAAPMGVGGCPGAEGDPRAEGGILMLRRGIPDLGGIPEPKGSPKPRGVPSWGNPQV